MDEETQHNDEPTGGDDTTVITELFQDAMNQRRKADLAAIADSIAGLSKPDRASVADVIDDAGNTRDEPIVSRHQPTDTLYRTLYQQRPAMKEARTPDLDHWNAKWLRSFLVGDRVGMQVAKSKLSTISGARGTTLGGTLDASDPTAIVDGTGGHLLPQEFANVVEIARQAAAVVAPLCTNFTTSGSTLRVPTAGAVTAVTAAEGAAPAAAEPTFTSEMLILHKIGARMIASIEMLEDSSFNLMDIYATRAGEGIGAKEDEQICATDGTSPNLTEKIAGGDVSEATSTVLIYEDLNTLFFALGKAYQRNSTFLAGTVVCTLLSNMMDGNDHPVLKIPSGAPLPISDVPSAIGTVLGRPIYHVPLAAGTLILGDLRGYGFVRKGGIVASMDGSVGFATDTVQFKFTERVDGRIIDDVAMKQMAGLATVA